MSTPSLYQPTEAEIAGVVASAKKRHPDCAARIDKAGEILSSGGLQLDSVAWEVRNVARWRIASQSGRGAYVVVGFHCPCEDRRAPMVAGACFCKHATAVSLYMKILRNRVQVDIDNFDIELGPLDNDRISGYAVRMGAAEFVKDGPTFDFANATSAVYYSLWLANRERARSAFPYALAA